MAGRAPDIVIDAPVEKIRRLAELRGLVAEARRNQPPSRSPYHDSPSRFAAECINWRGSPGLTPYQAEILDAVPTHKRVAVRGPHGLGKTTLDALLVLWFAATRDQAGIDWKVATTAGAWRQLERYLWPEIRKWSKQIRWDVYGRAPFDPRTEMLTLNIKLTFGQAFAVASDEPALIEGVHADAVLYVFDESKAIIPATFDAAEGAFSGAGGDQPIEALAIATSTPGEPSGRFYDIHSRKPGLEDWWTRHVTVDEAIAAGRISREWVEQRKLQWGATSAVYSNRVLGEFHSADEDGVIPLGWVEAANDRWRAWDEAGRPPSPGPVTVGVDVARSGADKTVMALRDGQVITELRKTSKEDTMQTTGRVKGIIDATPTRVPIVDVIGVGGGVVDRLRELKIPVVAFNASESTDQKDRSGELGFTNARSAAWWRLRELLDPAYTPTLALPPDDLLTGDLTGPHWRVMSGGRIQVESKDDIRKRIGRSTDDGDAVVQAVWDEDHGASAWIDFMARRATEQATEAAAAEAEAAGHLPDQAMTDAQRLAAAAQAQFRTQFRR